MRPWRLVRSSVCTTAAWRSVPARNCILRQRLSLARTNDGFGGFFDSGLLCPNDCAVRLPDPYDSPCQVGSAPCRLCQAIELTESCQLTAASGRRQKGLLTGRRIRAHRSGQAAPNPFVAVGICAWTQTALRPPALGRVCSGVGRKLLCAPTGFRGPLLCLDLYTSFCSHALPISRLSLALAAFYSADWSALPMHSAASSANVCVATAEPLSDASELPISGSSVVNVLLPSLAPSASLP
jgi:hypothetical protein